MFFAKKTRAFLIILFLSAFLLICFFRGEAQSSRKDFHGSFDVQFQNQASLMNGFRDRVKKFLNLFDGYAFNRIMSLGDEKKLCGMLGKGGHYRVFIIDPDVNKDGSRTWTRTQQSGVSSTNPEKAEASQFTAADWKSGWTATTKKNGKLITKNDFLLLAEIWESSGEWNPLENKQWSDQQVPWHESCHAAFYRTYGNKYDSDTEHIYIENYTERSTQILNRTLIPVEHKIEEANKIFLKVSSGGKRKLTGQQEKQIWMPVRDKWIIFKGEWIRHHKSIPNTPQILRDFVNVTGVRLFTINEIQKVYEAGYYLNKKGVKPPDWVFRDRLSNETVIVTAQPVKKTFPGSKKQVYSFHFIIISPSEGNKNVPTGKVSITLNEVFDGKMSGIINYTMFDILPKNKESYIARNTGFGTIDLAKDYDARGYRINLNILDPSEIRKKYSKLHLLIEYRDLSNNYTSCDQRVSFPIQPLEQAIQTVGSFDGLWNSPFGLVKFEISGSSVKGGYAYKGGRIRGEISPDGRTLTGIWKQRPSYKPPKDLGKVVFILSPDGKKASGTWGYGDSVTDGKWDLTRVAKEIALIDNRKNYSSGVMGPTTSNVFTINQPMSLTYIRTEHENYGKGASPGTIALRENNGKIHGPWQASGRSNSPINTWGVRLNNYKIPPGTYTVIDSDPSTWLYNKANKSGTCEIRGAPVE